MKKFFLLLVVSFISVCVIAEPIDAVLIVQNHASDEYQKPLSNLGDAISAELSQELFNIIDPNDVIGEQQNRGPWGENMPLSSATRLAENLEAQVLITAAVGETSIISYGSPAKVNAVKMRLTLSAKRIPKGANVASVTVTEVSRQYTPSMLSQNADSIYYDLVENLVAKASKEFLAKCEKVAWKDMKIKLIEVAFGCNFPGADVSIDGVSYGTAGTIGEAPLKVKVSDGLHNVKISYPYTTPFEVRAKLQDGTTFMVVLRENEEGRKIRKEDKHFDLLMDRIEKSGATDDEARLLRAKGYGNYLSSSYTRIEGMPEVLSMRDCEMPDFGLNPDEDGDRTEPTTGELLNQAGTALGLPMPEQKEKHEQEIPIEGFVPMNDMNGVQNAPQQYNDPALEAGIIEQEANAFEQAPIDNPVVEQPQVQEEKTALDEVGDTVEKVGGIANSIKNIIDLF